MDREFKTFILYVAALEALPRSAGMIMHSSQAAQIIALKQDKAPTKVLPKYESYANIFSFDLIIMFLENTGINEHNIKLHEGKQPPYRQIYSLELIKLETLKTYIETHLKIGFIQPFKSPAGAPILFDKKLNSSVWLSVNYPDLNNLTIKNKYPLPFIGEALDWLCKAKQLTQLNLTSAYY